MVAWTIALTWSKVAYVHGEGEGRAAGSLDVGGGLLGGFAVLVGDDDAGAEGGESARAAAADAHGAAGDDGDPTVEGCEGFVEGHWGAPSGARGWKASP